ncbi:hypothetical protein GOP47_0019529 [Adiantum capillus-veneris]|uniref:Uncharacterized protein n=1 Tax=Adiantum capillus-veneris TaxID=13818 RepID=A0A9D4UB78_ADICA|nr:hypothetical protein GOP47_0019529 [Adiantum capillus-veneris]
MVLRKEITSSTCGFTKDVKKQALKKVDTLRMAAQRLSFRFLMFLVSKNVLLSMPFLARQWTQMATQDTCMYPSSMCTLSAWEIENCPWWIDMEKGHVLGHERELHDTMSRDAVIQKPLADRREASHADACNSQKEKETFVDTIIEEDMGSMPVSSGTIMARKTISFVYLVESPLQNISSFVDTGCMAIVGDYIAIVADFRAGVQNPIWIPIHEHLSRARSEATLYTRAGRAVPWAADFIFLDLPFGRSLVGSSTLPQWDICSEDHVRAGVHLAFSALADSGWLLIMVSTAGEAIRWVERFCCAAEMVVHRRIVVLHHGAYGHFESFGGPIVCLCSVLFMVHRVALSS